MRSLYIIALILTVIGSVNWGLVGLFNYDLVAHIFGDMTTASRVIYSLVGIAAVLLIALDLTPRHRTHLTAS